MGGSTNPLSRLLRRVFRQQEGALHRLAEGNTVKVRLAGFSKSERADAKFFLLAIAPFALVMVSDLAGLERGILWHAWFWISAVWAIGIGGIGFVAYWRAWRRSQRGKG